VRRVAARPSNLSPFTFHLLPLLALVEEDPIQGGADAGFGGQL
jgi:hypothetical protein